MNPLNSPIEVGLRVLMLLQEAFPEHLDLNQLVLLDHSLLHSGDVGGPQSLHPDGRTRAGELGIKREALEGGLQVMLRAGLAQARLGERGLEYWASESADAFTSLLETDYAAQLRARAIWVVDHFEELDESTLRSALSSAVSNWTEEFAVDVDEERY